jgi:flagellin-specific chaperone FliS
MYPIRLLNEWTKFIYFWKYFKSLVRDEMNEVILEKRVLRHQRWEEWIKIRQDWDKFSERKKIIHTLLWTLHEVVLKRIKTLWRNDVDEIQNGEDFWKDFSMNWRSIIKHANATNYDCKNSAHNTKSH